MDISAEKMLEVIEALIKGNYTQEDEETDFSGCYEEVTTPNGETGHKAIYDDCKSGTTPPVLHGVVEVAGVSIYYSDSGKDFYDSYPTEIEIVCDEYKSEESRNVEEDDDTPIKISDELEQLIRYNGDYFEDIDEYIEETEDSEGDTDGYFIKSGNLWYILESLIIGMFCVYDTWDVVPDDLLEDEAVDIEDCHLIEDENHGVINYDGKVYYIVEEDPAIYDNEVKEIKGKDDSVKFVYAIPETCSPNEYGKYGEVYLIGYNGEPESAEVVYIREQDATYDCVEQWIN